MKPATLEEALLLVPTHWLLTPGVDVWQDGDEFCSSSMWRPVKNPRWVGQDVGDNCRRPIPQDVRESAAWWLLHIHINDVSQSLTDELIEVLGGRERFKKEISAGPDPLGRWILAGKL